MATTMDSSMAESSAVRNLLQIATAFQSNLTYDPDNGDVSLSQVWTLNSLSPPCILFSAK
jgi:hypothetical protein